MKTSTVLDLFKLDNDGSSQKQKEDPKINIQGDVEMRGSNSGLSKVWDEMGQLWDQRQYSEEFNLETFISKMKKSDDS